jgi:hypothetical protein
MREALYSIFVVVFVAVMLVLNIAWAMSFSGCATRQATPGIRLSTGFCFPQGDQSKDPCELEFWEDQQFDQHGR